MFESVSLFTKSLNLYLLKCFETQVLLLGAIVSNTNPVSVVTLMKEVGIPTSIITSFNAEAMMNATSSVVLYDLFFQLAGGSHISGFSQVAEAITALTLGAIVLGLVWAVVVIWMIGRVQSDPITETSMVIAPCYILYYVAQFHLHMSGVLAVTVFGLCFPWWGNTRISPGLFPFIESFLSIASHIAETLVFVIAGVLVAMRVGNTFVANDYGRGVAFWAVSNVARLVTLVILAPVRGRPPLFSFFSFVFFLHLFLFSLFLLHGLISP